MAGRYTQFSPSTGGSPQLGIRPSSVVAEHDKYKYVKLSLSSLNRWRFCRGVYVLICELVSGFDLIFIACVLSAKPSSGAR